MQDPSHGVAQPLQNHVHLISGHRYPSLQQISPEQVLTWLREAPQIVHKTASMAWVYVQAPADGSVWLEWISPRNVDNRYPSDGYLWGDPESSWQQEIGGYTMELLYHRVGYRPSYDQHATHARTRYHLVAKNPNINAAAPDPSLYIVHYHQTDPGHVIPSPQVPINASMRQILQERRHLEGVGRIERREFMLHDREHWPTITLPGGAAHMPQAAHYGNQMPQNRFPQMPGYQAGPGGPPAKRQRFSGPAGGLPGPQDGGADTSIEDEENIALGDFFDHLTPREISLARYMQHHQWIEEVFSSPYASSRIIPPDLGLGLMGELKGLTEGLLDAPSLDEINRPAARPPRAKEAQPFTNLKKEQVDEFNRRVEQHLQEGHAEIEKMKEEHAAKMAEWKKSKGITEAEKRLRYATWEGHESAVPAVYRVDVGSTNGESEPQRPKESVEDVVKDAETLLGRKIGSHNDSTLIREGGLEKEEEQPKDQVMQDDDMGAFDMDGTNAPSNDAQSSTVNDQSVGSTVQNDAQSTNQTEMQQPAGESTLQPQQPDQPSNAVGDTDMGDDTMMGDMDLDTDLELDGVDFGDVDTGDAGAEDNETGNASATAAENAPITQAQAPTTTDAPTTAPSVSASGPIPTTEPTQPLSTTDAPQPDEIPSTTQPSGAPLPPPSAPSAVSQPDPSSTIAPLPTTATAKPPNPDTTATSTTNPPIDSSSNLFDDNTFADLADMGSTGAGGDDTDDGLIDFDGGMGLDDSAFGDAMHSMNDDDQAASGGNGGEGQMSGGIGGGGGGAGDP